jgi:peptidoglycan/LPS O-acetylase OafA/YrhL
VLWRQINYFNNSAAFEPLLHVWSLAIEEQYYLLLPLTLAMVPRRWWMPAIVAAAAVSLAAYARLYPHAPGATFYLRPTRAWEIGLGSISAVLAGRRCARSASEWSSSARRPRPISTSANAGNAGSGASLGDTRAALRDRHR